MTLPDNVLSFLDKLSPEQREGLRKELIGQLKTQREARVATSETTATTQERGSGGHAPVESLTSLDGLSDTTVEAFDHNLLSHDRQCLRATLEEWARQASETSAIVISSSEKASLLARATVFADLHKWWDATSYTIHNDWLFTDEPFLTIVLRNANGEEKTFRLRVAP